MKCPEWIYFCGQKIDWLLSWAEGEGGILSKKGNRYEVSFEDDEKVLKFIMQMVCITLSDQISRSVVSNFLRPHESQHARHPCPSPTPGVHSDSGPSSQWCHPAISSSGIPFSSCPQSLPASEYFPMSQLFTWGGQSTGVSALASFLPKKSHNSINIPKSIHCINRWIL